jgi:SAM-dependent methyltransferase
MSENHRPKVLAATADSHVLYQRAVQEPAAEVEFVNREFRKLRKRMPARLREDFCGTAAVCCEWVRVRPANTAVGLDLCADTLEWARTHNLARLSPSRRRRVRLLRRDVRRPGPGAAGMDLVLAMNFSWWVFRTRSDLLGYFASVRRSLVRDGLFVLDIYGGWESMREQTDRRVVGGSKRGFTYLWHQAAFDPITHHMKAHIHFQLRDRSRIRRAFTYDWRLWTIPETRDALTDAGFTRSTVYWEGEDSRGEGNGVFTPAEHGDAGPAFIAYLVAQP